ncbi:DUF6059 family protein [Streptomyces olivaceoviridis]|uniref:DUF6059 family protein n=1 Tax=Streptomyces olivaceoviridis TaxID=1921 RepID=UPI003701D628
MRGLAATGSIWVSVPVGTADEGPAPGHPERLGSGTPSTAAERALRRQLKGVGRGVWWSHWGPVADVRRRESSTAGAPRR